MCLALTSYCYCSTLPWFIFWPGDTNSKLLASTDETALHTLQQSLLVPFTKKYVMDALKTWSQQRSISRTTDSQALMFCGKDRGNRKKKPAAFTRTVFDCLCSMRGSYKACKGSSNTWEDQSQFQIMMVKGTRVGGVKDLIQNKKIYIKKWKTLRIEVAACLCFPSNKI